MQELEVIALLMREVAALRRTRLTLSDLILYVARGSRYMPIFLSTIYSKIVRGEQLAPKLLLELNNAVLQTHDEIRKRLDANSFSPANRRDQIAGAVTSKVCFTVSDFSTHCQVSPDTANRWLSALVEANVLRKLKVGNKFYFINTLHFATLQNLVFPLGEIQPPTDSRHSRSQVKFTSYFPRYLESANPPF